MRLIKAIKPFGRQCLSLGESFRLKVSNVQRQYFTGHPRACEIGMTLSRPRDEEL
jgi:hypothetical protein